MRRDSENESVRALFPPSVELCGGDRATFDLKRSRGGAQVHFPALLLNCGFAALIELRERHGRDTQAVAGAIRQKCLPEHIDPVTSIGFIELFVQSADQHNAPEALDRAFGLAAAAQPLQHGYSAVLI